MFLLQLLKMGKMQELLKTGLRLLRQHGILQEGQHDMTVTVTFSGASDKQAQTAFTVTYNQGRLSKYPQILTLETADWTVSDSQLKEPIVP